MNRPNRQLHQNKGILFSVFIFGCCSVIGMIVNNQKIERLEKDLKEIKVRLERLEKK